MKVVITGANGFVGKHICREMQKHGHHVRAVVRRVGTAPTGTEEAIVSAIDGLTDWRAILSGVDSVIHLAARVHMLEDHSANPLAEYRLVNSIGTRRLAEQCKEEGISRFVFLSSIKVNGESTPTMGFSVHSIPNPVDSYGVSKHEAEQALEEIADDNFAPVIIRTPMIYGPGVGGNFQRLMGMANKGVPAPFLCIRNRRTLISIWNLCDLLRRAVSWRNTEKLLMLAGDQESLATPELYRVLGVTLGKTARNFPVPVGLLVYAGRLLGRTNEISRLTDSLEVVTGCSDPSYSWSPPLSVRESMRRMAEEVSLARTNS